MSCESALDEALPFYVNPTYLELNVGSHSTRFHVGAIVGDMLVLLLFGFGSFVVAVCHGAWSGRPGERSVLGVRYRSLGAGRFPGSILFPLMFFIQPFVGSSLTLLVHGNSNGAVIAVVILVTVTLFVVAICSVLLDKANFLATFRTKEHVEFDRLMTEHENAKLGITQKIEDKSCMDKFGDFYEDKFEGLYGWWFCVPREFEHLDYDQREKIDLAILRKESIGHKDFVRRNGAMFDSYSGQYRWFLIFEIVASVALGIGDGLVESFGCSSVAILVAVVFGLYVVAVFVIRPFCSRKDFIFAGIITLLNFTGAILTALPGGMIDDERRERDIILVSSAALIIGTVAAIEGLVANGTRFVAEKVWGGDDHGDDDNEKHGDTGKTEERMDRGEQNEHIHVQTDDVPMLEVPRTDHQNAKLLEQHARHVAQLLAPHPQAEPPVSPPLPSTAVSNQADLDEL